MSKCRGKSEGESVERLKHHLHASKLHYLTRLEAEEIAEAHEWQFHDTDEADVPDVPPGWPPGLVPPSPSSGAPLALRRSRSRSITRDGHLTPSPARSGLQRRNRNLLAIGASTFSTRTDDGRREEMEYRRVITAVESSIRAARHAERLSDAAAQAFAREAGKLEIALDALQRIA